MKSRDFKSEVFAKLAPIDCERSFEVVRLTDGFPE